VSPAVCVDYAPPTGDRRYRRPVSGEVEQLRTREQRNKQRERKLARLRREWQFLALVILVAGSALAAWSFAHEYWVGVARLATMIVLEVAAYVIYERRSRKVAE
jgi:hypothetical protein